MKTKIRNERWKEKAKRTLAEGSLTRKGKVFYFPSREGILNCEGYEINSLDENYFNYNSSELFSLKEVCFYDNNQPLFFVYRGLNFSTLLEFDKVNKIYREKKYDDDYMINVRSSQWLKRITNIKPAITLKFVLSLIITWIITGIITVITWIGILRFLM